MKKDKRFDILDSRIKSMKSWKKKLRGKNISEFCRQAKISRAAIYSTLSGLTIPSKKTFDKINKILNPDEQR